MILLSFNLYEITIFSPYISSPFQRLLFSFTFLLLGLATHEIPSGFSFNKRERIESIFIVLFLDEASTIEMMLEDPYSG